MYNLGIQAMESADTGTAAEWFERATAAGVGRGYAALVELAERSGNAPAARHWAHAGAEAGDPRCMGTYAMQLMEEDQRNFDRSMQWYEKGAQLGNPDCMLRAGQGWNYRGNKTQARYWLDQAQQAGHEHAADMIRKYCP